MDPTAASQEAHSLSTEGSGRAAFLAVVVIVLGAVWDAFAFTQKSDVTSVKREFRSLMPDTYSKMFAKAELDDMLAYLSRLGAKP